MGIEADEVLTLLTSIALVCEGSLAFLPRFEVGAELPEMLFFLDLDTCGGFGGIVLLFGELEYGTNTRDSFEAFGCID